MPTRSRNYEQPDGVFTTYGVTVLDAARQKNEISLFQIENRLAASKGDRTLKYIEHFILGPMRVVGRLLTFPCDVFKDGSTTAGPNLTGFHSKVNAKAIGPALARLERIRLNSILRLIHTFLHRNRFELHNQADNMDWLSVTHYTDIYQLADSFQLQTSGLQFACVHTGLSERLLADDDLPFIRL